MTIDATVAFGAYGTLGIRNMFYIEATTPRLMHLHAYASLMPSPVTVARLASE